MISSISVYTYMVPLPPTPHPSLRPTCAVHAQDRHISWSAAGVRQCLPQHRLLRRPIGCGEAAGPPILVHGRACQHCQHPGCLGRVHTEGLGIQTCVIFSPEWGVLMEAVRV